MAGGGAMSTPPADRFRVGDIWQSPRGKRWKVERLSDYKGALLRAMHTKHCVTQWRKEFATGDNMENTWLRIDPPTEETP
jgi:hypothetical protein